MDVANSIAACWSHMNATSAADAVFWTEAELYQWADEEAQRLARSAGVFVESATQALVGGTGRYALPGRHLDTVEAIAVSRTLHEAGIEELFALDREWAGRQAPQPLKYAQDEIGLDWITLYPAPDGTLPGNLKVIHVQRPPAISSGSSTITTPVVLQDEFMFAALAGARMKESPGAMPDVAEFCASVADTYRQAVGALWGK